MLNPALELVSMNMTPNSLALASPSSIDTCLHISQKSSFVSNSHPLCNAPETNLSRQQNWVSNAKHNAGSPSDKTANK
jgi:hypothetical protein